MKSLDRTPPEERRFWALLVMAFAAVWLVVTLYHVVRGEKSGGWAAPMLVAVLMWSLAAWTSNKTAQVFLILAGVLFFFLALLLLA